MCVCVCALHIPHIKLEIVTSARYHHYYTVCSQVSVRIWSILMMRVSPPGGQSSTNWSNSGESIPIRESCGLGNVDFNVFLLILEGTWLSN